MKAQSPGDLVERARMETFVAVRLGATAAVLLTAPAWLLFAAPLAIWQCLVFVCALAPFLAVLTLARGASLRVAQTVSIGGLFALALVVTFAGIDGRVVAFAVLMLAMLEAVGAGDARFAIPASIVAFVILAIVGLAPTQSSAPLSPAWLSAAMFVMLAYAAAIGWATARTNDVAYFRERRETMRHEALAQTIGDLVLRQDRMGSVVSATQESLGLFGLAPRELLGRGLFERIHVGDRPTFLTTISGALEGEETASCVVRLRRGVLNDSGAASGEPSFAWIEMRSRRVPIERRAEDPYDHASVVSIVRDVTRARKAEEDIRAAQLSAEQANVWKDRFLANVSHELRTPLNAIIGFAEILGNVDLAPTDPARTREYANIIHGSGQHLLEMVNSILDMSKIDAGSFDIVPEPFDLPPLLDQCCDMMGLKANEGQVRLVRDYPSQLAELVADKRACKQVLINLLSNAVKFTPAGGTVTVSARPEGAMFVISVADTGIGIDSADLQHIGDPFFQAHHATTRAYEGTGLGLSLVRGLVGLHGGSISVESAAGQGATFVVRLPAHCAAPQRGGASARIETIVRVGANSVAGPAELPSSTVKKIA